MTDYARLVMAADWRLDKLEAAIATTDAINRTHDLVSDLTTALDQSLKH